MDKENHNCDNINCNHNDTKGLCCLFNPDNCKYRQLQKENAELKEQISIKDILIRELQEQRVYWKESSFDWRHKFFKLDKVKRLIRKDKQLNKAKELLKQWIELYKPKLEGYPITPIQEQTKQFLSEGEK